HSECFELLVAVALEREKRERERCEELRQLLFGDHDYLPGSRDRSCRQCGEPPAGGADPCIPLRPDGAERALERWLKPAIEASRAPRLEVRDAGGGRIDGEACVLERADDLLPPLLGPGRVGLDEHERRARGERLPQPHPWPHAKRLGRGGDGTDERLPL